MVDIISPVDGRVYAQRALADGQEIESALAKAEAAQAKWASTDMATRQQLITAMLAIIDQQRDVIGEELAWQMGRPVRYGGNEINGFMERASHMAAIAESALQALVPSEKPGFTRYIARRPIRLCVCYCSVELPLFDCCEFDCPRAHGWQCGDFETFCPDHALR